MAPGDRVAFKARIIRGGSDNQPEGNGVYRRVKPPIRKSLVCEAALCADA